MFRALAMCAGFLLATPVAYAAQPTPQERSEAKRLYAEAHKLQKAGDLTGAIKGFERAHELAPTPVTRLDLARALVGVGSLVRAHALASSITEMPKSSTETEKSQKARAAAVGLATDLEARIPTVRLSFDQTKPWKEVAVDDSVVSKELLAAPIAFDPGRRVVRLTMIDGRTADTPFALVEQDRSTVLVTVPPDPVLELEPPPRAPLDAVVLPVEAPTLVAPRLPARAAETRREPKGASAAGPVLVGVGGASVLAGAIAGGVALGQASYLLSRCTLGVCGTHLQDEVAAHRATGMASNLLIGLGAGAATAGAIVWIVEATTQSDAPTARARATVGGLTLEGAW